MNKFYTSSLSRSTGSRGSNFSINKAENMRPYLPGGTWGHKGFKIQHVLTKEDWDKAFVKAEQLDKEETPEIIKELHNQSSHWTNRSSREMRPSNEARRRKDNAAQAMLGLGHNLDTQLTPIQEEPEGGGNIQHGGSASRIVNQKTAADRAMSMWLGDKCDSNFKRIWFNKLDKSPVFLCPNAVTGFCPSNIGFILLKKINNIETSDESKKTSDPLMNELLLYKPVSFKEFILNPYEKYRLGAPIINSAIIVKGDNLFHKSQEAMRNNEDLTKTLNTIDDYIPLDIFESPLLEEMANTDAYFNSLLPYV